MNISTRASRFAATAGLALVSAISLAGCGQHVDKISDLNGNPNRYMHHEVTVAGEVTRVYELPLGITNIAAYRVNDGTGQIWVISHSGAPNQGDKVGLKGDVEPVSDVSAGLLGNIMGNVIQERQRRMQ